MLTNKALHSEIEAIENLIMDKKLIEKDPIGVAQLKIGTLTLKLLLSIRTNQVLVMRKMGVQPIEPAAKRAGTTDAKTE